MSRLFIVRFMIPSKFKSTQYSGAVSFNKVLKHIATIQQSVKTCEMNDYTSSRFAFAELIKLIEVHQIVIIQVGYQSLSIYGYNWSQVIMTTETSIFCFHQPLSSISQQSLTNTNTWLKASRATPFLMRKSLVSATICVSPSAMRTPRLCLLA